MARRPKNLLDDDEDMATEWPMVKSYTTEDGKKVSVYKSGHAVESSNKFSVRPRKAAHILGI